MLPQMNCDFAKSFDFTKILKKIARIIKIVSMLKLCYESSEAVMPELFRLRPVYILIASEQKQHSLVFRSEP